MSFDLKIVNGDLAIASNAGVAIVENGEKLTQDILKIVMTELGADKRFPWYGCPISQSLIGRAFDKVFVETVASNQLRYSITQLQKLQGEQQQSEQVVTPQELIGAIQTVQVNQNVIDPRFYNINVNVISKAFRRVPASFNMRL